MTDRLLTVQDVADRWQVGEAWVRREVRAGRLPHERFGRSVRFTPEQIAAAEAAAAHAVVEAAPATTADEWGLTERSQRRSA